jgi:molybdate transport system permease protein
MSIDAKVCAIQSELGSIGTVVLRIAAVLMGGFLALPLIALVHRAVVQPDLWNTLQQPMVIWALRLSLLTSLSSLVLAIVFGTPVAYLLARRGGRRSTLIDTLIDLPMVLPPTVAGVALLMTFGRRGLLGQWRDSAGLLVAFTTVAEVLAQSFVSTPYYILAAQAGFQGVERELESVAYTLGHSPWRTFVRITVPLALPALISGSVMTWARALGEFGATVMFAGNLMGRTQTMPLAIYIAMESDLRSALVLATMLILVPFSVLLCMRLLLRRGVFGVYA